MGGSRWRGDWAGPCPLFPAVSVSAVPAAAVPALSPPALCVMGGGLRGGGGSPGGGSSPDGEEMAAAGLVCVCVCGEWGLSEGARRNVHGARRRGKA